MKDGSDESFEWDEVYDLTSVPGRELERQLDDFSREEREVSYRRRVLQGRIDLIRSELVRRGSFSVTPDELARALLGDSSANLDSPIGFNDADEDSMDDPENPKELEDPENFEDSGYSGEPGDSRI